MSNIIPTEFFEQGISHRDFSLSGVQYDPRHIIGSAEYLPYGHPVLTAMRMQTTPQGQTTLDDALYAETHPDPTEADNGEDEEGEGE